MATWHWLLAGGAAAYLLLKNKAWAPASPQQQGYAATATDMQQLTSELYALVPEACKSAFASASYNTPSAGTIWLQGVLSDARSYPDLATARADMASVVSAVCANTVPVGSYGSSYGSSYRY